MKIVSSADLRYALYSRNNHCVMLDACDASTCPEGHVCALSDSGLPVCYSSACMENGVLKDCGSQKCVNGECTDIAWEAVESCDNGYLDEAGKCIVPLKSISIAVNGVSTGSADVLLNSTVTFSVVYEPENTTERDVVWKTKNVTEGAETEDVSKLVTVSGADSEQFSMKGVSLHAGEIDLTVQAAEHENISADSKVYVKPYYAIQSGDAYDNYKTFHKGDLSCEFYNKHDVDVFNYDLFVKYVQPKMIPRDENGEIVYYPTRASVVAAARFLAMQFPYYFPYHMESISSNTMRSHYVWSSTKLASDPESVRVYGLNLTSNAYNSHLNDKVIATKVKPWGCSLSSEKAGLECSGMVAWALRNGRFEAGDFKTDMFSGTTYKNKEKVYATSYSFNVNNKHDLVVDKFSGLDNKNDYIKVENITEDQIHAGDILWHGTYKKDDGNTGSGHVAMVIGVKHDSNNKPQYIYVAEATTHTETHRGGNVVTRYAWSKFKSSKWKSTDKYKCYLIRMDNVYSYFQKKYNLEQDTNAYDDFW